MGVDRTLCLQDGRMLAWRECGDAGGQPVLYAHGWPGSRLQAERYAEAAQRAGVRLIAPDRPGIGGSSPLPGRTLRDWPADVAALLDYLALERVGLLGVSGGAGPSLVCAALLSERVRSVVVASAWGLPRALPKRALHRARMAVWLLTPIARRRPERLLRLGQRLLPPCDQGIVCRPQYHALAAADLRESFRGGAGRLLSDLDTLAQEWAVDLAAIPVPIAIVHGMQDRIAPMGMAQELAVQAPGARLMALPGAGHYLSIPLAEGLLRLALLPDAEAAEDLV